MPSSSPTRPASVSAAARGPLHVLGLEPDERDDVRRADPRMRSFVGAQVDPVTRALDARKQRGHQLLARADQREDRPVVVGIRVDVEQPRLPPERLRERADRRAVTPFGEVRHRLERPRHTRSLGRQ